VHLCAGNARKQANATAEQVRPDCRGERPLTRCGAGPLWLDVRGPACHDGRHDLALRPWLVQKLVIVRIALRYPCPFRRERERKCVRQAIYMCVCVFYRRTEERTQRTDEHAVAHKGAHLATRVDREPLAQDELQLVRSCGSARTSTTTCALVVAVPVPVIIVVHAPLKDRLGTKIVHDKVGRLQEHIHLCGGRASQRRGRRGQEPCRILQSTHNTEKSIVIICLFFCCLKKMKVCTGWGALKQW
jgi:hypothetical protein